MDICGTPPRNKADFRVGLIFFENLADFMSCFTGGVTRNTV